LWPDRRPDLDPPSAPAGAAPDKRPDRQDSQNRDDDNGGGERQVAFLAEERAGELTPPAVLGFAGMQQPTGQRPVRNLTRAW